MPDDKPGSDAKITIGGTGSIVKTVYTERSELLYGVFQSELDSLSLFNWITTLFGSLGLSSIAFLIGFWADIAKDPNSVTRPSMVGFIAFVSIVVSIVSFVISGIAYYKGNSLRDRIIARSKSRESIC